MLHSMALDWIAIKCFSYVSVPHYFKAQLLSLYSQLISIFF